MALRGIKIWLGAVRDRRERNRHKAGSVKSGQIILCGDCNCHKFLKMETIYCFEMKTCGKPNTPAPLAQLLQADEIDQSALRSAFDFLIQHPTPRRVMVISDQDLHAPASKPTPAMDAALRQNRIWKRGA